MTGSRTDARSVLPRGLDRTGVLISTACAVHCALMPLVAGVLPLIGLGFLRSERTEWALFLSAAGIAIWSLAGGCRHHGRTSPLVLTGIGFALILTARLAELAPLPEALLSVTGALHIASAHALNWRLCCGHPQRSASPKC